MGIILVSEEVNVREILETATYLLGVTYNTGSLWIESLFRRHDDRPWSMRRVRREASKVSGTSEVPAVSEATLQIASRIIFMAAPQLQSGGLPEAFRISRSSGRSVNPPKPMPYL